MKLRSAIRYALPHGIVELYWRRERQRQDDLYQTRMEARNARRRAPVARSDADARPVFSHDAALSFLDRSGIAPFHSRDGSMPRVALDFMARHFDGLDATRPILGLHIGTFLGGSLAYLADALTALHPESRVIAIDPNVPHRGIARPADVAIALLTAFGLEDRVSIVQGYSLEKSVSNDGEIFEGYDPAANWGSERACTQQLPLFGTFCAGRVDVCLMDGNHDADYLRREIAAVHHLLRRDALLVLDDVSAPWPEIQSTFAAIAPDSFEKIGSDGRIGVLRRR